jgi:hypothetical protein
VQPWAPDQQRTARALRSIRGTTATPHHRTAAANLLDGATIQSSNHGREGGVRHPPRFGVPPMWILLLLPFIGLLWVPFYNFQEPALFGFPFFYWYQLVWVPISSLLIWLVYRRRTPDETP